jgi:hypothetical protein
MGRKRGVERGPLKIFLHLLGGHDEIINESMQNHQLIKNERYRHGQRLCLEAWHINMSHHALNRDDGAYLQEEYMHLIGR